MRLARVHPGDRVEVELGADAARERIAQWYATPRRDWVRINLVASVSGSAAGEDGTSESLTNRADRTILGVIREASDVVLIGAESLRREGYVVPKRARLAVVTRSGDLTGHRLDASVDPERVIVICAVGASGRVAASLAPARATIIELPLDGESLDPRAIVAALRSRECRSIVCEGGPGLASSLVRHGIVDELCLTTSPVLNGAALPPFGSSEFDRVSLELVSLVVDESSGVYTRWFTAAG